MTTTPEDNPTDQPPGDGTDTTHAALVEATAETLFNLAEQRARSFAKWTDPGIANWRRAEYRAQAETIVNSTNNPTNEPATDDTTEAPRLDDVTMLWANGYYDGPLDGVCLYRDQLHWFTLPLNTQTDPDDQRVFEIYALADTDARALVTQHLLFEQHVGTHMCAHAKLGHGRGGIVHPTAQHQRYYDNKHTPFTPTPDHQPIGTWDYYGTSTPGPAEHIPDETPTG